MNELEIFYRDIENYEGEVYHLEEDITDPKLKEIDALYGISDALSIENQEKHKKSLKRLGSTGALITLAFLLYDEAEIHMLIGGCIIMLAFLYIIRRKAYEGEYHRKYMDYRMIAESTRVHYFLVCAGMKLSVYDILPWFTQTGIPWIKDVLSSLPSPEVSEKRSILNIWVRDQLDYHVRAKKRLETEKKREKKYYKTALYISLISYAFALGFELYLITYSPDIDVNTIRAILKIIVGGMSAGTLFLSSYYGKMSLSNIIEDHRRMIELYRRAEREIQETGESEKLIEYLAREFLIENSAWYAYQIKNKPDLVL